MLRIFLSYLVCLPAAVLCFLPVRGQFRYRIVPTLAMLGTGLLTMIVLATFLTWRLELKENDLLIPMIFLSFMAYHLSLKAPVIKELSVFFTVMALLSILTNYAACFDAALDPNSGMGSYTLTFSLFQIGITLLALILLFRLFMKHETFITELPASSPAWYGNILFSLVTIIYNVALFPQVYYSVHEHVLTVNMVIFIFAGLSGWLLMQFVLTTVFDGIRTIARMKERNRILELQESQFRSQQKYIRASEKTRHDFRHNIQTLAELYHAGNIEAVGAYLDQYIGSMPKNEISSFCSNTALNAQLNYFVHIAELNGIDFVLRINLPDELPVSDVDLCSMVGNILENAVTACQGTDEKQIRLTVLTENEAQLYIVAENSFDGGVRMRDGRYLSTKQPYSGVGLSSVSSTAEKYGGVAQFSYEGKRFFSNIAIPII